MKADPRAHILAAPETQWEKGMRQCGVDGWETAEHIRSRSSFCLSESLQNVKNL